MGIEDVDVFIGTGRRQGASTGSRPLAGRGGRPWINLCPTTRRACVFSTTSRPTTGACWWWSTSPRLSEPWLQHDAVLEVIATCPTPAELKRAGKARIDARLKKHGCRRHATWAAQIVSALECQSVTVDGTDAAAVVLPPAPPRLLPPRARRADVAAQVETLAGGPSSCARF